MSKTSIKKALASDKPVTLDVIYVALGEKLHLVNSWCDIVDVEPVEIPVTEEMQCKKCACYPFLDAESYRCNFACCNYNRMDGKAVRFKEIQKQ